MFQLNLFLLFEEGAEQAVQSSGEGFGPSRSSEVERTVTVLKTHTHANTRWRHKQAPTHINWLPSGLSGLINWLRLALTRGCLKLWDKVVRLHSQWQKRWDFHSFIRSHTRYRFQSVNNPFFVRNCVFASTFKAAFETQRIVRQDLKPCTLVYWENKLMIIFPRWLRPLSDCSWEQLLISLQSLSGYSSEKALTDGAVSTHRAGWVVLQEGPQDVEEQLEKEYTAHKWEQVQD